MKSDRDLQKTFIKVDYINWTRQQDARSHGGVVTLYLKLDPNRCRMKMGFSFCNPKDRFSRKEGVRYAKRRFEHCPIEVQVLYRADFMAMEVVRALCLRDWPTLEKVSSEIHTGLWDRGVPSWALKWYDQAFRPKTPRTPSEQLGDALVAWGDEIRNMILDEVAFHVTNNTQISNEALGRPPGD